MGVSGEVCVNTFECESTQLGDPGCVCVCERERDRQTDRNACQVPPVVQEHPSCPPGALAPVYKDLGLNSSHIVVPSSVGDLAVLWASASWSGEWGWLPGSEASLR
jgi:hypothetical protein